MLICLEVIFATSSSYLIKMKYFLNFFFWPIFLVSQLIALALISWHLMAQVHFAYPLGYKMLGLHEHIAEFAPLNRYKDNFEFTTHEDHWRLFGEICDAIQNSGKGLADIQYTLTEGQATSLMHQDEIIHLQDVAHLVDKFYQVGYFAIVLWLACWLIALSRQLTPPPTHKVLIGFLSLIGVIGMIVILIGAKDIFYWLHIQIFPENHKWFFYYQDSLMTTLMKAPDIFAFITILLLTELIIFWIICIYMMKKLLFSSKK